ncbi:MAG: CoB--CoM heterodisulfide reductase iron-sulfur subunit D [Candidatus Bathyarchaeota archaeon BA1]|nr:MAG: CoB--CoM heterodisulfide reductase iron-sulfur subunit D [Candidatus Bathyarchaeota archaeon BA1]
MEQSIEGLVQQVVKETKVYNCLECGKCTSGCPVARIDEDYSPRRTIENMFFDLKSLLSGSEIWNCLTCYICDIRCPSNVRFSEFVRALRRIVTSFKLRDVRAYSLLPSVLLEMMEDPEIQRNRLGWIQSDAKISKRGDIAYFVGCLPYFDALFEPISMRATRITQAVLSILNKANIAPVVLVNEKCCGHDALWSGNQDVFEKLARENTENLKDAGVRKVLVGCPECFRTLKIDCAEFLGSLDFEVVHMSEFLVNLLEKDKIKFKELPKEKIAYHDPCRLTRHLKIHEAPRAILNKISGLELVEMERSREESLCCGVSSWLNCGEVREHLQLTKLRDIKAKGVNKMVTTCPKCQIHFTCFLREKGSQIPLNDTRLEICDLFTIVDEASIRVGEPL